MKDLSNYEFINTLLKHPITVKLIPYLLCGVVLLSRADNMKHLLTLQLVAFCWDDEFTIWSRPKFFLQSRAGFHQQSGGD